MSHKDHQASNMPPLTLKQCDNTTHALRMRNMRPIAVACALLMAGSQQLAMGAALTLAQVPAGNGGKEPAPNLIISVDDSGSMGSTGMTALRNALNSSFSPAAIPDESIRLGFQAMWRCRGLSDKPYKSMSYTCPDTRVQSFGGTHRTNFNNWVNALTDENGTPSHQMMKLVDDYMATTTGVWSPFANKPGVTETPLLACRKTFHIYMTDGGWNSTNDNNTPPRNVLGRPGNADGTAQTLPDGTFFDPYVTTADQNRIYRDSFLPVMNDMISTTDTNRGTVASFADWAFFMWANDYAPDSSSRKPHMSINLPNLANTVRPIIRQAGSADYGTTGTPYWITEYWNPKNNPMTWQGITTYTIGFNNAALTTATAFTNTNIYNYPTGGTGTNSTFVTRQHPRWSGNTWSPDIASMIRGETFSGNELTWGNPLRNQASVSNSLSNDTNSAKRYELWHAAINGRGRFVPATNATELTNAFSEIINQVIADSSAPMASISANTQAITSGTTAYVAGYDAAKWSGHVKAYALQANYNLSGTPTWDSAQVLDSTSPSSRLIFTHNGTAPTSFDWSNLSTAQKNLIKGSDNDTTGQNRLAYIRGDRTKEQTANGPFRNRSTRLGSIVNSNMWVVGKPNLGYTANGYASFRSVNASRPTMIYLGANDGMLHGFNAATGAEQFAYVPLGIYSKLKAYTDPSYTHQYTVDGHPYTGDIHNGTSWQTMLVGTLAGGGKGYFVLNVTTPNSLASSSATSLLVTDKTDGSDADIGHMYPEPTLDTSNPERVVQITRLNNDRWAVLLGNGINSANEKAVLLIQYLDGAKELVKLVMDGTGANGNGLSNPQVIDINGDGKADLAYAGDHLGNLWKVDLSSSSEGNWGSYYKSGSTPVPLFVASDGTTRQPITTAPQWTTHPEKGLMIAVGTGREMTVADRLTSSTQSLYAIWDDSTVTPGGSPMMSGGTAITNGRASLVAQTQTSTVTISGRDYFKTSSNPVLYTGAGAKRGWYMDWPTLKERSVNNGGMLTNRLLYMRSRVPANGSQDSSNTESCEPTATSAKEYLTILDIVTGAPPSKPMFDTDGGGFTGSEEPNVSRWHSGRSDRLMIKTGKPGEWVSLSGRLGGPSTSDPTCTGNNCNTSDPPCNGNDCNTRFGPPIPVTEFGWRQLQ